jgi:hypothetical protein
MVVHDYLVKRFRMDDTLVSNTAALKLMRRTRRSQDCNKVRSDRSIQGVTHMKIWFGTCAAIAIAFTVGVLAQDSPAPQASSAQKPITVTGCIQKAAQAPTGTTGTAAPGSAMKEPQFVLANAAISGASATGTAGATPPVTAVASEYRLDADDAKLTPHVGHKVEITGTPEAASRSTQPPAASAANAPKLKVDSIKMISATCP